MANNTVFNDDNDVKFNIDSEYNGEGELDADGMHDQVFL